MNPLIHSSASEIVARISSANLMETTRQIARWIRLSGSPEERAAFEYVRDQLNRYGLHTTWLEHPALVSWPLESSLAVLADDGSALADVNCLTHAFAASVENLQAQVVDLGFGTEQDYRAQDVRGKIVLLNGLARPTAAYQAEQAGAVGQIYINDDHLHNMIVSTIWGTPTPDSAQRIPRTPVVSVVEADGHALRARIAASPTRVRIHTRVFCEWQTTPLVVGELRGSASDDWVMLSGHLDSWDYGAMDNGSANATMLEVARVLALAKSQLYRGVRVIFWSGHSHGRYAGSTWYADNTWQELYDHCVAHVNVDSTGAQGATAYNIFETHPELAELGKDMIETQTGQSTQPRRMSRAGDMSFNGIGIPALFMEMSQVPLTDANRNYVTLSSGSLFGSAMPWWWHSSQDTLDKIDPAVLELDTKIYAATLWRLTTEPVIPANLVPATAEIQRELDDLQQTAGHHVDFSELRRRADLLAAHTEQLMRRARVAQDPAEIREINEQIKAFSRLLMPVTCTLAGAFDHDPAWSVPFLPGLQPARQLAALNPHGNDYQMIRTQVVRNANASALALRQAIHMLST